ncbi:MAG: hypothetical protein ACKPJJ_03250, partial [Planctomycetaceae bacterium]
HRARGARVGHGDVVEVDHAGTSTRPRAMRGAGTGTGGAVRAGLHGQRPDLANLQDGDLQFSTDFREVYATVLERWLKVDSSEILLGRFQPLDLFSA